MHNIRITNIIIILLYTMSVLWFSSVLLGYNSLYLKILIIALAVMPFALTNIIKSRRYWLIIGLGSTMFVSQIPLPLLDAISIGYSVNAVILCLLFAEQAIRKTSFPKIFETFPNRAMALFMFIVTARFLYDRPGAGSMGGMGGLSSALPTLLAGWCFFSTYILAKQFKIDKVHLKLLYLISFLGIADVIYKNFTIFIPNGFINIFPYPAIWFISFFSITSIINKFSDKKDISLDIKLIIATSLVIILSFLSLNRAPVLYAPLGLFVLYWCYKYLNKYIILLLLGILLVVATTSLYPSLIPRPIMRTMSLFTYNSNSRELRELGETGWQSDWRATLAQIAWQDIKRHPIAGKGFAFSFEELYFNAQLANSGDEARFGGLLSSGGYHNSVLFCAVKLGIPATLCLFLAIINIYYRFLKFSRKLEHSELKQFSVSIAAIFICILGKMLTNGGPLDLFSMSIMVATMQGIMIQQTEEQNTKTII